MVVFFDVVNCLDGLFQGRTSSSLIRALGATVSAGDS